MIEDFFGIIGQDQTLDIAYGHIKHSRGILFTGPHGCGKSSMIAASAQIMSERRGQSFPMVIPFCHPLKQFTLAIAEKLHRRNLLEQEYLSQDFDTLRKKLNREHYRFTVALILKAFRTYPGIFIGIDDLESLSPTGRSIILDISNSGAIVCAACTKKTTTVKRILYNLQEIQIPPLHDNTVKKIASAFINERGLLVEDREHFVENVAWKTAGNPLALDNMLKYFVNQAHIRIEDVRGLSQGAGRKETSLEWIIYAMFALMIMLRFVSRATMNKQLYIITSAVVALFVVMRYFMSRGNRSDATA